MRTISLLCILFGAASLLRAEGQTSPQATPPPLAPGPLLNRAPAVAQWLVSMTSGTEATVKIPDQQTQFAERILVRKSGDLRYEISVDATGQKKERWCEGALQASVIPGQEPTVSMYSPTAKGSSFTDYSKTDFPGFDWIAKENYMGVDVMEGIPCIVFHAGPLEIGAAPSGNPSTSGTSASALIQTGTTAYIRATGRLPVLLANDGVLTLYQFETPAATPLAPPPNVQSMLDVMHARIEQSAVPMAAP